MDWFATAGNVLFGAMPEQSLPSHHSPLNEAVTELRRRGLSVAPAEDVPGLWNVSGHPELTTNQRWAVAHTDVSWSTPDLSTIVC